LIREAGRHGLIDSVEEWFSYHRARNLTSHTYSEKLADEVYQVAKNMEPEVKKLIDKIEKLIE